MRQRLWQLSVIFIFVVNLLFAGNVGVIPTQAAAKQAPARALSVTPEAVDITVNGGLTNSIALAPDGAPRIAYYDSTNGNLRYASKVGLTWQLQTLDVNGDVGLTPSLAIDEDGLAHIAYYDETNDDLLYARQQSPDPGDPGAPLWVITRVDETNLVGKNASLALDALQRPHIAYWDTTNHALKYALFNGSTWQLTSVAGTTDLLSDSSISLALTSDNLPRIVYRQSVGQSPTGLGYASFNGTTWSVETAYVSSFVGERFSLALDTSNNPRVSFMLIEGGLRYLQKSTAWSTPEVVVNNPLVGSLNSLALDSEGRPRIVYFDGSTAPYSMGYAYKDGTFWRFEKLVDNGSSPDLAFAPDGSAHISYLNQSNNQQYYLTIPPFPDLQVADMWLTGSTVNFQIINTGLSDAPTGVKVALLVGGSKVETKTLTTGIPAGGRSDQSFDYTYICTPGATIIVRADADPGALIAETRRSNNSRSESWKCKGTKPTITVGPTVTGITQNSATITWTTNTATDSLVKYSRRAGFLTSSANNPALVTSHSINLTSLAAGVSYAFEVTSTDIAGQSVTSKTAFFETLPPTGTVSPLITRSITKDDGPGEVYTLKASVPGATGLEKVDFYYKLTPTSPLVLIGTAFNGTLGGGGTLEFAAKFSPGKTNLSRLDLSSANIITQVSLPGGTPQNFEDMFGFLSETLMEVSISAPNPDHTFYITSGTTLPAGTLLPVSAHASGFEWECDWSGADPLPDCADVAKPVDEMLLKIGSKVKHYTAPGYDFSYTFDLAGMGEGDYTLMAKAYYGDKTTWEEIPIHIKMGTPQPTLERTVVRNGNSFRVTLTIKNDASASGPLVVDRILDSVRGFQPVFDDIGDEKVNTAYEPSSRITQVMVDLDNGGSETRSIPPGGSHPFSYDLVPILYENDVQYGIGNGFQTNLIYLLGSSEYSRLYNLPVTTLADPTQITLAASVAKALKMDDYLLVTHPANLKAKFGSQTTEPTWNTLLRRMAELAQIRQGALAYLDSQDFNTLDNLLDPASHTWADKLHPNFSKYAQGYVLIVGEPEIVPSYTKTGLLGGTVRMTDNPLANTGGNGAPELVLGRIPGDDIPQLIAPIITSLRVLRGELFNDRSHALGTSGTGDGIAGFQSSAENIKSNLQGLGVSVTLYHEEEKARTTLPITVEFDDGDLLAAGDLDGDGDQELVIGDVSTDDIYVVSISEGGYSRDLWLHYPYDIKAGHGFAAGDLDGDLIDELVIADDNDHIYMFKFPSGFLEIDQPFDNWDKLALGNMDGDTQKEIIITHNGFVVKRNLDGTSAGSGFLLAVNPADDLAAGRVWDSDMIAEIILMSASQNMGFIYSLDGTLRASFPAVYNEGDFVIVADVDKDPADPKPDEIWVLNTEGESIQGYYEYGAEPKFIYIPQRVMEGDKIAALKRAGDIKPSIWLVRRTDDTYQLDRSYPKYMQTLYLGSTNDADYLFYRGHGSPQSWESVIVNMNPVPDYGTAAPLAYGTTCLSGDYSVKASASLSERMLWWGAGAFIGATEISYGSFNVNAAEWFSNHFKDQGPFNRLLVQYKNKKYDDGTNASNADWPYWVYEYNFYGDAKFGFIGDTTVLPAPDAAPRMAASSSLHVDVPAYAVTQTEGYDFVDIPGGEITQNDGELRIPYYVVIEDYPKGTRVNNVTLTARGGLTTASGLVLPIYDLQIDGQVLPSTMPKPTTLSASDEIGWMPSQDQVFSWQVNERGDGSTQLVIRLSPFYYDSLTTDVEFYTSYDFNIETATTKQEIAYLNTDKPVYRLNQPVTVNALISNNSASAADVLASATLYSISGAPAAGADLRILKAIAGNSTASYGVTFNTTGLTAGSYYIEMELRDTTGNVIDTETVDLELGMVSAQITTLTATPKLFKTGDAVNIKLAVTNNGDLLLSGAVAQVTVSDLTGLVVASFNQPLADLAASASTNVPLVWTTTGATQWRYTVEGRILYNSQSTPVSSAFVDTQLRLYLPAISR